MQYNCHGLIQYNSHVPLQYNSHIPIQNNIHIIFGGTVQSQLNHFLKKNLFEACCITAKEITVIEHPYVCLAPFFCRKRLDFITFLCWYLTKNASGLSRTFGTGKWGRCIQAITSVINFVSVVENSVDKYRISIARGRFIKDYL